MKHTVVELQSKAYQYRRRFLELFTEIGFGHVTSAFSWIEIATVLYNEIMDVPKSIEDVAGHDRIVVSKGHGVGALFPIFEDMGYFSKKDMENMVKIGGQNKKLRSLYYPGFDFYGGSLGIGIGVAAGLAKADKLSENNKKTFCIVGDAECYEGSVWEAASFAAHNRLNNLIVVIDRNELGCSDFTEHMLALESLENKWKAFNWETIVIDGHDIEDIFNNIYKLILNNSEKPKCVIAKTKKGKGLDYLIDRPLMHGYMPKGEDIDKAFRELKIV